MSDPTDRHRVPARSTTRSRASLASTFAAAVVLVVVPACDEPEGRELAADTDGEDDRAGSGLFEGVNGNACLVSPYNCKLRVSGGNRVLRNDGGTDWGTYTGVPVRDGDGNVVATSTKTKVAFNYGQTRVFDSEPYAMAMSTSNSSAGWMPISSIKGQESFENKVGHVSAKSAGLAKMGCYEVRNDHDPVLEFKKVVYDSTATHERAGDYLPLVRANGQRSVNLVFNVPGMALGGPAIDHFPAGTKFQRVDVPTEHGVPSIDIPLWVQDAQGRYRKQSGTMKFLYGYVIAATGTKRNGWMAYDALQVSNGCDPTPPPPPPPPAGAGQCYARCCDGELEGPALVADAPACHSASQTMCAAHDHVLRTELDGAEVWHRPNRCWAKCANRQAYHSLDDVTEGCTAQASAWCDVGDRGGLEDAAWSRCQP